MRLSAVLCGLVVVAFSVVDGLYTTSSPVRVVSAEEFASEVKGGGADANGTYYLVEFFAPWCSHCKGFVSDYEKAASVLRGIVKVVALEDGSVMAEEGVKSYPTIKLYLGKEGGARTYHGERTASGLVNFVMTELRSLASKRLGSRIKDDGKPNESKAKTSFVPIALTNNNFDQTVLKDTESVWFVMFYAPWCGHCKALAPTWNSLAKRLQGKVKIGKVDATAHQALAARFQIKGYPTLLLFPRGDKDDASSVPYEGDRSLSSLEEFASNHASSTRGRAPAVTQLLSDDQLKEHCSSGLCILAFLPHILDSSVNQRNGYISEVKAAAKQLRDMPVKLFWLQAGDNFDVEEKLHLQFGWPAVIALRIDKAKFSIHRGEFSASALKSFAAALMSGRSPLSELPKDLPAFAEVKAWDGKMPQIVDEDTTDVSREADDAEL